MKNIIEIKNNDIETAIKETNKLRLSNKNKWVFIEIVGLKATVLIKSYNLWLQVFKTDSEQILGEGCMNQSIAKYKTELRQGLGKIK